MVAIMGFEKVTLRIIDGAEAKLDENVFVINGKKDGGGTASVKISGLAVDPVKTFASNKPYHISGKGVGDAKADFDIVDLPEKIQNAILGLEPDDDGIVTATSDTEAPDVAVLIEDTDIRGNRVMLGFSTGKFAFDGTEMSTGQGKAEELTPETLSYTIGANDAGEYYKRYIGKEEASKTALLKALGMDFSTPATTTTTIEA
ncbi:major tail protein [Lactococcus garvieae]|uniref:Phage tail protein n=1 Tax=Lactococcus garvieae TaxID=1363 RepID=A0AAX3NDZ2_9LACT|nr:major tail protein [Lactococcus garvieae]NHI70443.1 phage tail protein [Lactococcus garvieae]NHJ06349.1 phage tail protein [Lactococcus garvieae]WEA14827.1 phage tail protein [Lactococcus garvieae]